MLVSIALCCVTLLCIALCCFALLFVVLHLGRVLDVLWLCFACMLPMAWLCLNYGCLVYGVVVSCLCFGCVSVVHGLCIAY